MTIESDLATVLGSVVGGRAYPDAFPQNVQWPAIRYSFVVVVPDQTVCASGDDNASDFTVQIDAVAKDSMGRDALRTAIQAAMLTYPIQNACESWDKSSELDANNVRFFRVRLDYLLQPSSPTP